MAQPLSRQAKKWLGMGFQPCWRLARPRRVNEPLELSLSSQPGADVPQRHVTPRASTDGKAMTGVLPWGAVGQLCQTLKDELLYSARAIIGRLYTNATLYCVCCTCRLASVRVPRASDHIATWHAGRCSAMIRSQQLSPGLRAAFSCAISSPIRCSRPRAVTLLAGSVSLQLPAAPQRRSVRAPNGWTFNAQPPAQE